MSGPWRIIEHSPADAAWNMAVDEAILVSAVDGESVPTIRFFRWEGPSITFGYMLKADSELNIGLCRERNVPFIRRLTGGGVVFHGCDITFSVVFPRELAPETSSALSSYRFINGIFLRAFESLGVKASLLSGDGVSRDKTNVCFVDPTMYDVLYKGKKLVGNAQRRRKGWVLNHGSMLYNTGYREMVDLVANVDDAQKAFAENCVSIGEISDSITREDVIRAVTTQLATDLDVDVAPGDLSEGESRLADDLAANKYSTDQWNFDKRVV